VTTKLYCGDALCKAPVHITPARSGPWPVRCAACGTALYPADVLASLPANELEPRRGELMAERAGIRVAVSSKELPQAAAAPAATGAESTDDGSLDRLLAMVELDPAAARARRRRVVVVALAVSAALAIFALVAILIATSP